MENPNEQKEGIKKLTTEESFDRVFKELEAMSGCFEPEGKKIILGKIRNLEESFKTASEMKIALHELCNSIKKKSVIIKEFVIKRTQTLRDYISERIKERKRKNYFKNKEKQLRNREKYES